MAFIVESSAVLKFTLPAEMPSDVAGLRIYRQEGGQPVSYEDDSAYFSVSQLAAYGEFTANSVLTIPVADMGFAPATGQVRFAGGLQDLRGNISDLQLSQQVTVDNDAPPKLTSVEYVANPLPIV